MVTMRQRRIVRRRTCARASCRIVTCGHAIVARFEYDAWGNILSATSSVPALAVNRYRFQCREWSAATGLVNFRARWYDPVTGRWISKDPIGLSGGLNLYVFCGNDPVNGSDPYGLTGMVFFLRPTPLLLDGSPKVLPRIRLNLLNLKRRLKMPKKTATA